jgi:hypothetical protein
MLGDSITARKQSGEVPESMEVVDVSQLLLRSVKQPDAHEADTLASVGAPSGSSTSA